MLENLKYSVSLDFKGRRTYLLFLVCIPFLLIFISLPAYIQGQAITSFMAFFMFFYYNHKECKSDFFSKYLLVLFFIGCFVGIIFILLGYSDFYKFLQYSFLALLGYISYRSGFIIANKYYFFSFIFLIILADAMMVIPLILKGSVNRTSVGASNLFPLLLIFILNMKWFKRKKDQYLIIISFVILIIACLLSGMRSVLGVMIISLLFVFLYMLFKFKRLFKLLKSLLYLLIGGVILLLVMPVSIKKIGYDRINTVIIRFNHTLFSENGTKLDEDSAGSRKLEAQSAINEFKNRDIPVTYFLGYGHGYSYYDFMQSRVKSHVHITYIALFVRYGFLGIIFYILLFCAVLYKTFIVFFKKRTPENFFVLGFWLSSLQVLLTSIIAASLINSLNMFIIGASFGYDLYLKKSNLNNLKRSIGIMFENDHQNRENI